MGYFDHWYDYLPGVNAVQGVRDVASNASGIKNALEGDPNSLSNSLQNLMQTAYAQGDKTKNFLMGQKGNAEAYYKPMQQMFGNMYGTGGVMPGKAPGAPGGGMP